MIFARVIAASLFLRAESAHIAYATCTHGARHRMIDAAQATWRAGIPSLIVTNSSLDSVEAPMPERTHDAEVWFSGPDAGPPWNTPAEQRCTGVPRLANATLDFDFLAVSDDETVWLFDNADALLRGVDPDAPLHLADKFGIDEFKFACTLPGETSAVGSSGCITTPPEQPCSRDVMLRNSTCQPDRVPQVPGERVPRPSGAVWVMGNAGALLSRGLLRTITPEDFASCEHCIPAEFNCYGGYDVRLGECFWSFADNRRGVAPTIPYGGSARVFGADFGAVRNAAQTVASGAPCDSTCTSLLYTTITMEYKRHDGTYDAEEVERDYTDFHRLYTEAKHILESTRPY